MEGVTMNGRRDRYLSLEVPGLAERRPSLVNGDFIFVKLGSGHGTTNVAYQVCPCLPVLNLSTIHNVRSL